MADLMTYEHELPNILRERTHLWIEIDGKIRYRTLTQKTRRKIHSNYWGPRVWSIRERGYVFENLGLISVHGEATPELKRKLAKKFKSCCYIKEHDLRGG